MLCDRAYFEPQLAQLQSVADVSVATYPSLCTITDMALSVLDAAPDRFAVAGHSMGGRVAQEIVARSPDRVLGLGLFGTDYRGLQSEDERSAEEVRRRDWLALIDEAGFEHFVEQWAPRLVAPARRSDLGLLSRISEMARRFGREGLDAHCRAGLSRPDYSSLLGRIAVPTLVIAGSEDTVRPAQLHRSMAARIRDARVAIIKGAGHMMSMEDPEAVNAQMLPWIASLAR